MAFTVSMVNQTVLGNMRVQFLDVTADATTGVISSSLDVYYGATSNSKSMASAPFSVKENELCAGTASAGNIGISGVASGDKFQIIAFGR